MNDEGGHYYYLDQHFAGHGVVRHGQEEYVNPDDRTIHTNTIEGYFSIFKRGMKGVYQHTSKKHLHRYLAEFDFRYNHRVALGVNDMGRTETALRGIVGKRLTYRIGTHPRRDRRSSQFGLAMSADMMLRQRRHGSAFQRKN
jgi:hypothetical protein